MPASSHLWSYQSFNNKRHQFGREADLALGEQALKMFLEAGANPVSEIGSRTVTVHGDFLPSNMLYTEDGLQLPGCRSISFRLVLFFFFSKLLSLWGEIAVSCLRSLRLT